jgi:hypothetical protein
MASNYEQDLPFSLRAKFRFCFFCSRVNVDSEFVSSVPSAVSSFVCGVSEERGSSPLSLAASAAFWAAYPSRFDLGVRFRFFFGGGFEAASEGVLSSCAVGAGSAFVVLEPWGAVAAASAELGVSSSAENPAWRYVLFSPKFVTRVMLQEMEV